MVSNSRFQGITSPPSQKKTPTVPMSVYRELAGELQSAQQQLQDLKQENHHLHQENQTLRLEIGKLVQSVHRLENTLNHWDHPPETQQNTRPLQKKVSAFEPPTSSTQNHWFTHEQADSGIAPDPHDSKEEINGWFIMAAVVMIVFTFSGIGFMVARPLLNQSSQNQS